MRRVPRIAIIGGGVGGLATALALERRGAEIVVCEQSPALNDIGAGLNLSPNALMALRVLGVEDQIIALGSESDFLVIRSWKSGRIISRMRRGAFRQQFGAPNLTVLGGLAEFERELIRARTDDGRKRAQARGVRFGRPLKLTGHQRQEVAQRLAEGAVQADLARGRRRSVKR
jgi:salicylate hydroxylase